MSEIRDGWHPMEEAPQDGTAILAWDSVANEANIVQHINGSWHAARCVDGQTIWFLIAWRPLPSAP